jgi:histone H3/H4
MNFDSSIKNILRNTRPSCEISLNSMSLLNSLIDSYMNTVAGLTLFIKNTKRILPSHIERAIRLEIKNVNIPDDFADLIIGFAKQKNDSDILVSLSVLRTYMKEPITKEALVFLSRCIEYIIHDILELVSITMYENKKMRISVDSVIGCIKSDEVLSKLFVIYNQEKTIFSKKVRTVLNEHTTRRISKEGLNILTAYVEGYIRNTLEKAHELCKFSDRHMISLDDIEYVEK